MTDSNGSRDASAGGDEPVSATVDRPVPEPVTDDATAELVRDAIGVARGELSDRQFSEKYGTATAIESDEDGTPERIGETLRIWSEEDR